MNKLHKDTLPHRGTTMIDWRTACELKSNVSFDYNGSTVILKIEDYDRFSRKLIVSFNGKESYIYTSEFLNCHIGKILGFRTGELVLQIGETLNTKNRDMIITKCFYKTTNYPSGGKKEKWYEYKCNKCGNFGMSLKSNLINNMNGCGNCYNILTHAPWMIVYFQGGAEEAALYSCYSKKKSFLSVLIVEESKLKEFLFIVFTKIDQLVVHVVMA